MKNNTLLVEMKKLIRQLRISELIEKVSQIDRLDENYLELQFLLLHGYLSRANFTSAQKVFDKVINLESIDDDSYTSFVLKSQLIKIQNCKIEDFNKSIEIFKGCMSSDDISVYNKALTYSLYGRSLILGINFGYISGLIKIDAMEMIKQSIDLFKLGGFDDEYSYELLYLAEKLSQKPLADNKKAISIYGIAKEIGYKTDNKIVVAYAEMGIIEANSNELFLNEVNENSITIISETFERALENLKLGNHLMPNAVVKSRLGILLLKYGIEYGIEYLKDAIDEYHLNNFFNEEQELNRQIASWYLEHGSHDLAKEYEQKARAFDKDIQISLSPKISQLNDIFRFYIEGRIDRGKELYQEIFSELEGHSLQNLFNLIHANNLKSIGFIEDSITIYKKVINSYLHLEVSSFLSDAYWNLAACLISKNYYEAKENIIKAILIDEKLEDNIAKVQHIKSLIDILIHQEKDENKGFFKINSEIEICLKEAFILLKDDATHSALLRLIEILQTKAMVFFLAGKFDDAINSFEEGSLILDNTNSKSQSYFFYAFYGMTCLQKARNEKSLHAYEKAVGLFEKSSSYIEHSSMIKEKSRVSGLIGICYMESGILEHDLEKANSNFNIAQSHFETGYDAERFIRIHSDNSTDISKQESMIRVGEDAQTYTEQAFNMHFYNTKNNIEAIKWLERMKAQALLEALKSRELLISNNDSDLKEIQDKYDDAFSNIINHIDNNTLIIQYYYNKKNLIVFGVKKNQKIPLAKSIPFNIEELKECVDMHFSPIYGNVKNMLKNDMEYQWQQFSYIIDSVEEWSNPNDLICFIPHGMLHQLPLHAFKTSDGKYLIERNPIVYNQSLSSLLYLLQKEKKSNFTLLNYVFGNSRSNLNFATKEALEVANILDTKAILEGKVTKDAVIESLSKAKILHISGHGVISENDGWDNGLQMSNDELLTSKDIFPKKIEADLVVLSGCNTGIHEYSIGDELTGLVRAFVHAGSNNLIVSLWKIDDLSTADFFKIFYTKLKDYPEKNKAKILQETVCEEISNGKNFFYWGAFQLTGNLI